MTKADATRKRIIEAAKECFDLMEESKVTLEDVRKRADIHRQTIYRFFKGKEELRRAVLLNCFDDMSKVAAETTMRCRTLEEAVIVGTIETLEYSKKYRMLLEIVHSNWRMVLTRKVKPDPIAERFDAGWEAVFNRAKRAGEIAPDWKFSDFSLWLRSVHYVIFVQRDSLTRAQQKKLLGQFIRPGFTSPPSHTAELPKRQSSTKRKGS